MNQKNLCYTTGELVHFYTGNRVKWEQFYPSEQFVFTRVAGDNLDVGRVLDVGCAAGGLGIALEERFLLSEYVGIDVNAQCIEKAKCIAKEQKVYNRRFFCGDIVEATELEKNGFDTVVSLGCADWNVLTDDMIASCWDYVKPGGYFVLTIRLTTEDSLRDITESYQYICFDENMQNDDCEKAPYVVLNIKDAFSILKDLTPKPENILAYGYWGKPSSSARTQFDRILFTALAVQKGKRDIADTRVECHWPVDSLLSL